MSLGGLITADVLNQEYQIVEILNANTYTITAKDTSGVTVTAVGQNHCASAEALLAALEPAGGATDAACVAGAAPPPSGCGGCEECVGFGPAIKQILASTPGELGAGVTNSRRLVILATLSLSKLSKTPSS